MLKSLFVKNLAVISEETVTFHNGLNILTGETGAGKSVLLGSVNLALGERVSRSMIREGAPYALVELTFTTEEPEIIEKLAELDIYPEDGCITLSRRITEQRSTARINGESVSASVLSEAAGLLMNVHGQQDTQLLLKERNHREILDSYGREDLHQAKREVFEAYREQERFRKELQDNSMDEASRKRTLDLLEYEIREIEEAKLIPGEDEALESMFRKASNAQKIIEDTGRALTCLTERGGASESLGQALQSLNRAAGYDEEASELADRLNEVEDLLQDVARDISGYLDDLEYDPEEYDRLRDRLDLINRLKTKYGSSIDDVLLYLDGRIAERDRLEDADRLLEELQNKLSEAQKKLKDNACVLSGLRKEAASMLEEELTVQLKELNFPSVEFSVDLSPVSPISQDGEERVEFMASLNPGQPLQRMSKAASGGELSRIMLALRTVLAEKDSIPTVIFDEIDTGISGRTAAKVAAKLRRIAEYRQVICITHLPQIAAAAEHHYLIEKQLLTDEVKTHIREVRDEAQIEELARMLGGDHLTEAAVENAKEMRRLALES